MNFTTYNTREENKNSSASYFKFSLLVANSSDTDGKPGRRPICFVPGIITVPLGVQFVGGINETCVNNRRQVCRWNLNSAINQ
jgi:hypothetical protein